MVVKANVAYVLWGYALRSVVIKTFFLKNKQTTKKPCPILSQKVLKAGEQEGVSVFSHRFPPADLHSSTEIMKFFNLSLQVTMIVWLATEVSHMYSSKDLKKDQKTKIMVKKEIQMWAPSSSPQMHKGVQCKTGTFGWLENSGAPEASLPRSSENKNSWRMYRMRNWGNRAGNQQFSLREWETEAVHSTLDLTELTVGPKHHRALKPDIARGFET